MSMHEASLCASETVFAVFHHFALPASASADAISEIRTVDLGTFPSFLAAQTVALNALNFCLRQLQAVGVSGKFCKDIDLVRRGLITQTCKNGKERPLSEYEIRAIQVRDPSTGGSEDTLFGTNSQQAGKPSAVVSLPTSEICFKIIERDPHWAQSRVPYLRKRDEWPFRRPDDPPYASTFSLDSHKRYCEPIVVRLSLREPDGVREEAKGLRKSAAIAQTLTPKQEKEKNRRQWLANMNKEALRRQAAFGKCQSTSANTRGNHHNKPADANAMQQVQPQSPTSNRLGGGEDIGPIYRGRRHSIVAT